MTDRLERIRRMWNESAKQTQNRILAIHFTENGKPVDEVVYKEIFAYINSIVKFMPEDIVLEVGAGSGLLLERIAEKVKSAYATDISSEMLKLVPYKENIKTFTMESDNLEFPGDSFDKVICNTVIQCFPDKEYAEKCFSEMVRVCKLGGKIFIGDIFNAYLKKYYQEETSKSKSLRNKIKQKCYQWLGEEKSDYEILYLYPFELEKWAYKYNCSDFQALLIPGTIKPLLYRMFRFEVLVTK
jgi:ubiquinone/menaquinone biosynthesis C-methylase UbiE